MAQLTTLNPAVVNISTSGDNTIVAAPAAGGVKAFQIVLVAAAPVSVTFKNGASTAQSGAIPLQANVPFILPYTGAPWFFSDAGTALIINLSGTVTVTGQVQYTSGA